MKIKILKIFICYCFVVKQLLMGQNLDFYNYEAKSIDGEIIKMEKYRGEIILIVNVASKCGYTPI